jgi:thioredoxin-related protein
MVFAAVIGLLAVAAAGVDATETEATSEPPKAIAWQGDVRDAQSEAQSQNRLLVVFVTKDRCKFCTKMKQSTLIDPAIVAEIGQNCVAVKGSSSAAAPVNGGERITAYPTTLLVSPDGRVLDRVRGYVTAGEFKRRLTGARQHIAGHRKSEDASPEAEIAATPKKSSRRRAAQR